MVAHTLSFVYAPSWCRHDCGAYIKSNVCATTRRPFPQSAKFDCAACTAQPPVVTVPEVVQCPEVPRVEK